MSLKSSKITTSCTNVDSPLGSMSMFLQIDNCPSARMFKNTTAFSLPSLFFIFTKSSITKGKSILKWVKKQREYCACMWIWLYRIPISFNDEIILGIIFS